MADAIRAVVPGCPPDEARRIAEHTAARGSGRVGRSAAGQALDEAALTAAIVAHIRHCHTPYDKLLMAGYEPADARDRVSDRIDEVLAAWRG